MVRALGVSLNTRSSGTIRRAARLTHSWNLAVNIGSDLGGGRALARGAIDVEDCVDDAGPAVQLRLAHAGCSHCAPAPAVVGERLERARPIIQLPRRHQ